MLKNWQNYTILSYTHILSFLCFCVFFFLNIFQEVPAVQVLGLEIFFNSGAVKAVQGISYGIEKDELFVLLGHNGAGKSTTINALVGNIRPSGGDALVFGYSCNSQMRSIHKMMGT